MSLIPQPYRTDEHGDAYRIPVHYLEPAVTCPWSGRDAPREDLDRCPVHGALDPFCEVNPEHLAAGVPAVVLVDTATTVIVPACNECSQGVTLSRRILM
jgi:hypothetical protein